jgi:hypothetical protein
MRTSHTASNARSQRLRLAMEREAFSRASSGHERFPRRHADHLDALVRSMAANRMIVFRS